MSPWIRAALLAPLLAAAPAPAYGEWVEWIADLAVDAEWSDNLGRSALESEEDADFLARPEASFGRIYQAGDRTRLSATFDAAGELHARFEELDALELGATLAALHEFGLGRAPWARAHLSGWHADLRDDERDSWFFEVGLEAGRSFGDRLDVSLAWAWRERDGGLGGFGRPGFSRDVWDQAGHRLRAEASLALIEPVSLVLGAELWDGDFDAVCPRAAGTGISAQSVHAKAVARDDVFGRKASDCVYRVDGQIWSALAELRIALARRVDLDLRYRLAYGDGRRLNYQTQVASVSLAWRY